MAMLLIVADSAKGLILTAPKSTLRPISSPIFLATNDLTTGGPTKKRNALKTRKTIAAILPVENIWRL